MRGFSEYRVEANGIRQHVIEAGSGPAILLCHGFPELGYSWRHQLRALADAGYRAIAPDMRGYGGTTVPDGVEHYTIFHLTGDMVALLEALGIAEAAIVGHDWGAPVAWTAAQLRPDLFRAVLGMSVPFARRGSISSLAKLRRAGLDAYYQLYFQTPGRAERELEADVDTAMRRIMWSLSAGPSTAWSGMIGPAGALAAFHEPDQPMPWIGDEDLARYGAAFRATGFAGALNWYRNIDRNWELTASLAGLGITQPAWFVIGDCDPILPAVRPAIDVLPQTVPGLRGTTMLPGVGHWLQQEASGAVNAVLIDFLARSFPATPG
ncbi:pimeloyl-ACP methyl ester carboxylesterase [Sphingomonas endophytica]|uniref:Pimeloyl-ACP methyl ester carboxylesterase n=1 Tax=Sphingomonas endophytica TaxID=869719 RepID=A0A7X0JEF6_9SPHN|nr:alpha/beta hydrolase [Sphingomonas endophytica]MBB6505016.1 pimeloyl-ACP methyl ester carboxylesterase [Sphingomonas endophytica]